MQVNKHEYSDNKYTIKCLSKPVFDIFSDVTSENLFLPFTGWGLIKQKEKKDMKTKLWIIAMSIIAGSYSAQATLIAEYDLVPVTASSSLAPSYVDSGYSITTLDLNNAANTYTSFSNHFYSTGWDLTLNAGKYFETTLSSSNAFVLTSIDFSMENKGAISTYWLRSSQDGFTSDLSTGDFLLGDVTDFSAGLTSLGTILSPLTLRWYIGSDSVAGFANHEPGGAGAGLPDIGQDLSFHGNFVSIPEPSVMGLMGVFGCSIWGIRRFFPKV